jgi:hypothetical protein
MSGPEPHSLMSVVPRYLPVTVKVPAWHGSKFQIVLLALGPYTHWPAKAW